MMQIERRNSSDLLSVIRVLLVAGVLALMAWNVSDVLAQDSGARFYDPEVHSDPAHPVQGEEIQLVIEGWLSDTAAYIADVQASQDENRIVVNMMLDSEGIGAEVLTAATHVVSLGALNAGGYFVSFRVDGQPQTRAFFVVRESVDDPIGSQFPVRVRIEPAKPHAGERVELFLEGEFPTPGHEPVEVMPLEQEENRFVYEVWFIPPEEPVLTVIEPFSYSLGAFVLDEGTYSFDLLVDGRELDVDPIEVTAAVKQDTLYLRWEGGFAAIQSWMRIREDLFAERSHELGEGEESGWISETFWNDWVGVMNEVEFASLPKAFPPEGTIADGFLYSITYRGNTVFLYEGASLPDAVEPLSEHVRQLFEAPLNSVRETSVTDWSLH